MKVEIYQLPTLPTSLRTSSPTSSGPLAPSGSFELAKVETPIHDNIRELVTWECKEHGVKS